MVRDCRRLGSVVVVALMFAGSGSNWASAQESTSRALAAELITLLEQGQLDAVAARDSESTDEFAAALYFPGRQLLVVSARYESPSLLVEQLDASNYRSVYTDLQSASIPDSKVFIDDLMADGLHARPGEGQPFDTFTEPAGAVSFNGEWQDQGMSEAEYDEAYEKAEAAYTHMLSLLIDQLKNSS